MKELLDKLSSYNVFNYLLPGILFAYLVDSISSYILLQTDIVIGLFLYYFLGLIISRIGSLLVEPFLKMIRFVKFAPYADFVAACKSDPKIELLSEANNMYRTFCAMLLLLGVIKSYDCLSQNYPILTTLAPYVSIAALLVLFLFSYKKQTEYIQHRVTANSQKSKPSDKRR